MKKIGLVIALVVAVGLVCGISAEPASAFLFGGGGGCGSGTSWFGGAGAGLGGGFGLFGLGGAKAGYGGGYGYGYGMPYYGSYGCYPAYKCKTWKKKHRAMKKAK